MGKDRSAGSDPSRQEKQTRTRTPEDRGLFGRLMLRFSISENGRSIFCALNLPKLEGSIYRILQKWQIQRHGFHVCGSASSQTKPLTAPHEKALLCGDTRLPTPASRRGSPRRCVCASAGAGLSTLRAQQELARKVSHHEKYRNE